MATENHADDRKCRRTALQLAVGLTAALALLLTVYVIWRLGGYAETLIQE